MTRPVATATQMIDDASVRVTRFDFGPGAEAGWYRHGFDYVITAITDCYMRSKNPAATRLCPLSRSV